MMIAPSIQTLIRARATDLGINPDYVFAYSIDSKVRAHDVSHLVIQINEITDSPKDYGSNRPLDRVANAQIKIFIPQTYTGDTSKLRDGLLSILTDAKWACTFDSGISTDPSADINVNTTQWRKKHYINNI